MPCRFVLAGVCALGDNKRRSIGGVAFRKVALRWRQRALNGTPLRSVPDYEGVYLNLMLE